MNPEIDWNINMVRARSARGLLPQLGGGIDWGDLKVAHLDTGVTRLPALGFGAGGTSWVLVDQGLNLMESGPPIDPLNYRGSPGHGTRTCSVLCAKATGPSEIGIAPGLPVVPCRIVDSVILAGKGRQKNVAQGIRHAVKLGCKVVSISLGFPTGVLTGPEGMGAAVDEAYEAGVIIVAAGGQGVNAACYPGKYNGTIGVGGVKSSGEIWFNYDAGDSWIDVWAPAEHVQRLNSLAGTGVVTQTSLVDEPGRRKPFPSSGGSSGSHDGSSGSGDGTSYATVHVAAAAAMWLLRHKEELARYPQPWQQVEAFRKMLVNTATGLTGNPLANRSGILDIDTMLRRALPPVTSLKKATPSIDMHY